MFEPVGLNQSDPTFERPGLESGIAMIDADACQYPKSSTLDIYVMLNVYVK